MAKSTIKIRAKEKGGVVTVKALMTHPMETGARKDKKTGKLIPCSFHPGGQLQGNGKTVMSADWSGGVSKNPYLSFKFKGAAKGDAVELTWVDNQGNSDTKTAKIR